MLYLAPEQEIFQPHPREARLVRILNISSALGTPVFLGVGLLARCFGVSDGLDHFLIVALFTATLTIPPYRRAWGFCSKDYSYELKLNLARVAAWSYFVMFGSLATIFFSKTSGAPLLDILPSIVYLHLALALFALCTLNYSTIWHASVKWRPFFFRLFLGAAAGILLLPIIPRGEVVSVRSNESSAIQSLKTIRLAEWRYTSTHPSFGFASSLSLLGPKEGHGWIDSRLATGRKDAYEFFLSTDNGNTAPQGPSFMIIARPRNFHHGAIRSFYTDSSGVIRFTAENRSATASDPPVQSATTP